VRVLGRGRDKGIQDCGLDFGCLVTLSRGPNRIGPGTCRLSQQCMHMGPGIDEMPCAVGGGELLGRSDEEGALNGKMRMLCVRSFVPPLAQSLRKDRVGAGAFMRVMER
jgi:hypothetical protein